MVLFVLTRPHTRQRMARFVRIATSRERVKNLIIKNGEKSMSNHIAGNWFVSVFQLFFMSNEQLERIAKNKNYRYTTRRNAENELSMRIP